MLQEVNAGQVDGKETEIEIAADEAAAETSDVQADQDQAEQDQADQAEQDQTDQREDLELIDVVAREEARQEAREEAEQEILRTFTVGKLYKIPKAININSVWRNLVWTRDQKNPQIKQSLENYVIVMSMDAVLHDMVHYNLFSQQTEIYNLSKVWWKREKYSLGFDDNDLRSLQLYMEYYYELKQEKKVIDAMEMQSHELAFHPVRDKLESLPQWDGVPRICDLFPVYLGAERCEYTTEVTKLFLLGAITRVFHPGTKFEAVPVLSGNKQGSGKSTLCRFLALNDDWFTDSVRKLDDEKVYEKLRGHWIVEFSEMLATANTRSVEDIKSFVSQQKDTYRIPYAKYSKDFPRQAVFIGTANPKDCLPKDVTGNRRFYPIHCLETRQEKHPLDNEQETRAFVEQCYAEAMTIYKSGNYELKLSREMEEYAEQIRMNFTPLDPEIGVIQDWLDNTYKDDYVCLKIIWDRALDRSGFKMTSTDVRNYGRIMDNAIKGWKRYDKSEDGRKRFTGAGTQTAWERVSQKVSQYCHSKSQERDVSVTDSPGEDAGEVDNNGFYQLTTEELDELPFE